MVSEFFLSFRIWFSQLHLQNWIKICTIKLYTISYDILLYSHKQPVEFGQRRLEIRTALLYRREKSSQNKTRFCAELVQKMKWFLFELLDRSLFLAKNINSCFLHNRYHLHNLLSIRFHDYSVYIEICVFTRKKKKSCNFRILWQKR